MHSIKYSLFSYPEKNNPENMTLAVAVPHMKIQICCATSAKWST